MWWDKFFEIIFFIGSLSVFILLVLSLFWASTTEGLQQIGKVQIWSKLFFFSFIISIFLFCLPMLHRTENYWYFPFFGEVNFFISIIFIIIIGCLALVGGGSHLFENKQKSDFLKYYRYTCQQSLNLLDALIKSNEFSEDIEEEIIEILDRGKLIEKCYKGDSTAVAQLKKELYI